MKLKEVYKILVEGRTKSISLEEARKYYQEKGGAVWTPANTQIFRGIEDFDKPHGIVRPSRYKRQSANTYNYYTLLIDNLPEWNEYPERSKSIVCSTDYTYANIYGNLYLIIPLGKIKFGVAPSDIWGSFDLTLDVFNGYLSRLHEDVYGSGKLSEDNFSEFKETIIDMDKRLKSGKTYDGRSYQDVIEDFEPGPTASMYDSMYTYRTFIEDYLDGGHSNLFEYIQDLLDPKENGFEVKTYSKNFQVGEEEEVWTSGNCLTLKYEKRVLDKFFDVNQNWDYLLGLTE